MSREDILVVGAGIGGLAAAKSLSLIGRRVRVVEQAEEIKEVGAGIQMGPNGFRMMDALGLLSELREIVVYPEDLILMDGVNASEITRIPVGADFRARFGHPYAVTHRADLHSLLLKACMADPAIEVTAGTTIVDHVTEDDAVIATTGAGQRLCASALVGADGLWSTTRRAVAADGDPVVSGHIAYRAVVPAEAIEERHRRNAMLLWAGPRNHLVQYPMRGGKFYNLVAVFHSDKYVQGWDRAGDPAELYARFAGNCDTVRRLLRKVETWRMWVLCDREPIKAWSKGSVVLLGDAAHPMLQYLAQGACMALEDAIVLAQAVAEHANDLPAAFEMYSQQRYLRTGRCQVMARIYGGFYHATGVARELASRFLASRGPAESVESLAWLYDFDPGRLPVPKMTVA